MKYLFSIILIYVLGFIGADNALLAQELNLAYDFKEGQEFRLTVRTQQFIEQDLGGFTQTVQNLIDSEIHFKVIEVLQDTAQLEVYYKTLYFSMDGPMGEGMVMSSQGDVSDPINRIVRSMVNNPFYVLLNKSGRILAVEGMDLVMEKISASLNEIDEDLKESIQATIDNQFGEESFKSSFMTGLIAYPEHPVEVGDTWSSLAVDYSTVPLEIKTDWELLDVKRQRANIQGSSTLESKKGRDEEDDENIGMTGTNSIRATINVNTGWLQQSTQSTDISGTMVLPPDKYFNEAVHIPLRIKTITRTTLK